MKNLLILLALLAAPFVSAEEWKTYVNKRFGYSIEYPAHARSNNLLEIEGGRLFQTPDENFTQHVNGGLSGDITVEGHYTAMLRSYKETMIPRWAASGMLWAEAGYRKVRGYRDLHALAAALASSTPASSLRSSACVADTNAEQPAP